MDLKYSSTVQRQRNRVERRAVRNRDRTRPGERDRLRAVGDRTRLAECDAAGIRAVAIAASAVRRRRTRGLVQPPVGDGMIVGDRLPYAPAAFTNVVSGFLTSRGSRVEHRRPCR